LLFGLPPVLVMAVLAVPSIPAVAAPAGEAKPASTCPAEVADENAALVTARICDGPVAIAALTTQTDTAVATAAGAVRWQHQYRPVRVRQGAGWVPLDTTLIAGPQGRVVPRATAVNMSFSGGGTGPMVTVADGKLSWSVGSPLGVLPVPVLSGDTANYLNVLPGVDLQLHAEVDGYTQLLVVKDRGAAGSSKLAHLRFALTGQGLTASTDKGGNLRVKDAKGALVFAGNNPVMWDATADLAGTTATAAAASGGRRPMTTTVVGNTLMVTPDRAFLADPATTFPVYLDPGVTATRSGWSQVDSGNPTTAYWNGAGDAQVGTSNAGTNKLRALFNLDLSTTPLAGKYVSAASLNLSETWSASCTAKQVDLYGTTAASSSTTWNTQPTWGTLQSSATVANGFSSSCPTAAVTMDATNAVQSAVNASASTVTLGVRATSETDSTAFKKFNNNPTLSITYTSYPTTSELSTTPSTPCITGSTRPYLNTTTPLLQARVTDPEGALVRPDFAWSTTGGTSVGDAQPVPGQASGQMFGATIGAGSLTNGSSYSWKVRGFDGTVWGSWSAACEFTVDTTAPTAAPTVTSTTYPSGTWAGATGTAGTFTFGASSIADIAAYVYGLDTDPTIVVNAATLGGTAAVSLTPTADGPHTLKVQSRDRGGNLSAVTSYTFKVGTGAVTAPTTGTQTASKVTLSGVSKTTSSGITYQWRRGDADTWTTIPAGDVTTTIGGAITWPVATTGSGAYPNLVWNVAQTVNNAEAGANALDGPVQVRASLSGTSSGTSTGVVFTLDRNKTSAATAQVGPGIVNLLTGSYTLGATDAATTGGLAVQRSFSSRQATDSDPMFGPGWTSSIGIPDAGTYTDLNVTGSLVQVGLADGSILGFTKTSTISGGATFTAEVGAGDTTLVYTTSGDTYTLTESSGNVVTFGHTSGAAAGLYTPTSMQAAGVTGGSVLSWAKVTVGGVDVVRPTKVLAPLPTGVSSCTTMVAGCRALTFTYATTTTASGSTLGDYAGRVQQVALTAWDPDLGTPAMRTVTLAQYSYDSTGLLRNVWDPRLDYTSGGTQHVITAYTYNTDGTIASLTPSGQQAWSFTYTTLPTDTGAGRLYKVTRTALSAGTSVQSVIYNVPISGSTAPVDMASNIARWGQTAVPVDATSIYPGDIVPDGNPAAGTPPSWPGDDRVTVHYMDTNGNETNLMQPGGAVDATFYDAYGNTIRQLSASNLVNALYASSTDTTAQEAALAQAESTINTYSTDGTQLLQTLQPEQDTVLPDWGTVRARTHTVYTYDEGAPSGGPFNLVTAQVESAQYTVSGAAVDTDKRTTTMTYDWTLQQPLTQTVDPNGLALVSRTSYDSTTGQITSITTPAGDAGGTTPATRKTVYYRAGTGSGFTDCDSSHPEWAGLPCRTYAAAQPASGSEIPYTLTTYDIYGHHRTVVEKNSTTTLRTTTATYDAAGRPSDVTVSSTLGTAVAQQHTVYDQATGYNTGTQSLDSLGAVTASLSRAFDTLGRPTSYTDADANTTAVTYDLLSRPATTNDGKATQTFTYNGGGEERGLPTQMVDGQAGTFTATYNTDGAIDTETRPDGITVRHYYNENGQPTGLEYLTDPACNTSTCTLYYDYTSPDTHNKIRWDSSSFSDGGYGYDNAGRLTGARQDLTTGCALRGYTFDTSSNRTQLTTYGPDSGGNCQDSNPATTRNWTYDTADRATNTGYTYDTLGRTLTIPGADTPAGTGNVTNTYYTNDLASTIAQGTTTTTYTLDVLTNRYRSYSTTISGTTVNHTNHYGGDSDSPSWITEATGYTRIIPGLAGVAAQYTGASAHLEWQFTNLHGDVVAMRTAGATGLTATYTTDEYGHTTVGPRYGYLGGAQRSTDNPGGFIAMGVRIYNTVTGRFLQVDSVYQGSCNNYDYTCADPINNQDLDGSIARCRWISCAAWINWGIALSWASVAFSFIPGWLCGLCAIVSIGFGVLSAAAFFFGNNKSKAIYELVTTVVSGVLGSVGSSLIKFELVSHGAPMVRVAQHSVSKVVRFLPGSARVRVENLFSSAIGLYSAAMNLL
jgi:RHS repeat-associated protein